jgi:5-hydroxyisourate hydrolase-like protein (transthyretin family)
MIVSLTVLDGDRGQPVAELPVRFEQQTSLGWELLAARRTTADGQVPGLPVQPEAGARYRCVLDTDCYFAMLGNSSFYSGVSVNLQPCGALGREQRVTVLLTQNSYFAYQTGTWSTGPAQD